MRRPSFLEYRNHHYLKLSGLLLVGVLLCLAVFDRGGRAAYGGTWSGYVLGILSACIVLLLAWYGVRKRRAPGIPERRSDDDRRRLIESATAETPAERRQAERRAASSAAGWRYGGTLQGWLSAHVYLGALLLVLASLHSGFRLGWNVHSLTYVLLLLMGASGLYGAFSYLRYPRLISENMGSETLTGLLRKIDEIDQQAGQHASGLPEDIQVPVALARQQTLLGGSMWQQLNCRKRACATDVALRRVKDLSERHIDGDQLRLMRELYSLLLRKQRLVAMVRDEISYNARMKIWLFVHVPLTFALLAALLLHVTVIVVFW